MLSLVLLLMIRSKLLLMQISFPSKQIDMENYESSYPSVEEEFDDHAKKITKYLIGRRNYPDSWSGRNRENSSG